VDATDGAPLGHYLPTGEAAGNTVTTWLTSLHIAAVGGVGYRVVATGLGLTVIVLSATGVIIWRRKKIVAIKQSGLNEIVPEIRTSKLTRHATPTQRESITLTPNSRHIK